MKMERMMIGSVVVLASFVALVGCARKTESESVGKPGVMERTGAAVDTVAEKTIDADVTVADKTVDAAKASAAAAKDVTGKVIDKTGETLQKAGEAVENAGESMREPPPVTVGN